MRVIPFDRFREGITLDTIRPFSARGSIECLAVVESMHRPRKTMLVPMNLVGKLLQPFWIEDEARRLENTDFIVPG